MSHVLPDAATAQAHLRIGFYCTRSGNYFGTFGETHLAGDGRGDFTASVFPNGSMHSIAYASDTLAGFDVQTKDAVSPLLDGTFAQSAASPSVSLEGSFADATYLSGTYLTPVGGSFQAVADASVAATYKFTGPTKAHPRTQRRAVARGLSILGWMTRTRSQAQTPLSPVQCQETGSRER